MNLNYNLNTTNPLIASLREKLNLTPQKLFQLQTFDPTLITSPLEMRDAEKWIDLLYQLKDTIIGIIPDYDADGILSGSLLYGSLYELGFTDVTLYPPRIDTGYGMSKKSVIELLELNPNITTILTTDNGIAAFDGITYAKELGLKVLVSDHHLGPDPEPPFDVAVNPNRHNDPSTYKGNAGTAVIWKMMVYYALKYYPEKMQAIYDLYPLAGTSLIADVMPMTLENRTLVDMAVKSMRDKVGLYQKSIGHHPKYSRIFEGLTQLWNVFDLNGKLKYGIDEGFLGFSLAPLLNSPRRMFGTSELGFQVFIDMGQDMPPFETATELFNVNETRKTVVNKIATSVIDQIKQKLTSAPPCIVVAVDAKPGIAGLIAGNIQNKFRVPTIVFSNEFFSGTGEIMTQDTLSKSTKVSMAASARSPEGLNIKDALDEINKTSPELLLSYGGHAGAAGVHIKCENLDKFVDACEVVFARIASETNYNVSEIEENELQEGYIFTLHPETSRGKYTFNLNEIHIDQLIELSKFVTSLKPFGNGFPEPVFRIELSKQDFTSGRITLAPIGKNNKKHAKLELPKIKAIFWNIKQETINQLYQDDYQYAYLTGKLATNSFRGVESMQLTVDNIFTE